MYTQSEDQQWMTRALELAAYAASQDEVPVGAVLVINDKAVGAGWNQPIATHDPTSHAEINAMREAAQQINNYRLVNSTLYVTLEPCAMCIGAMIHARVKRLVFGAQDSKAGAITSVFTIADEQRLNHQIQWSGGVLEAQCGALLTEFFRTRRKASSQA